MATIAAVAGCTFLSACATTGDPTQGGLFGWSETQARYRIAEREATLNSIEQDTAQQRSRAQYLEGRIDQAQRDADYVR